jgi:putative redox protein
MSNEVISAVESGRGAFHLDILAHGIVISADEPIADGGLGLGFTPTELLCAALAACTTMTLRLYCRRRKWTLKSIRTEVTQTPRPDEGGQAHFDRTIHLDGDLSEDNAARLLAVANRCPVHLTLEAGSKIGTQLRAVAGPGAR